MSWSWFTGPLTYKDKCIWCDKPLQLGAGVVQWTDGYRYHVGCLLDVVAAYAVQPRAQAVQAGGTYVEWDRQVIGGSVTP